MLDQAQQLGYPRFRMGHTNVSMAYRPSVRYVAARGRHICSVAYLRKREEGNLRKDAMKKSRQLFGGSLYNPD